MNESGIENVAEGIREVQFQDRFERPEIKHAIWTAEETSPRLDRRSLFWKIFALSAISICTGVALSSGLGYLRFGAVAIPNYVIIVLGFISWSKIAFTAIAAPTPRYIYPLLDRPGAVDQFAVRITLVRGNVAYGSDEGVISFVDEILHYSGLRTTFSLSRQRTHRLKLSNKKERSDLVEIRWDDEEFVGKLIVRPYRLDRRFNPFAKNGFLAKKGFSTALQFLTDIRFFIALQEFDRGSGWAPSTSVVLPPKVPQTDWIKRTALKARVFEAVSLLALIGLFSLRFDFGGSAVKVILLAPAIWIVTGGFSRKVHQLIAFSRGETGARRRRPLHWPMLLTRLKTLTK
jgi:hypothetical protein